MATIWDYDSKRLKTAAHIHGICRWSFMDRYMYDFKVGGERTDELLRKRWSSPKDGRSVKGAGNV